MPRRLKVLVCAYGCNPHRGSEAAVGWGWSEAISRHHDLWIVTAQQEREDIEAELRRRPELSERLHFHYVPRRWWRWLEKVWPPAYLWSYRLQWQVAAYRAARRLHEEIGFDVAHQLTYVGFRVPGLLWKLEIPFVWGPIGGLEKTPWRLLPALGAYGCLYFAGRNVVNSLHKRFLPGPKRAFRRARGGIIAATTGMQREIRRWYGEDSQVLCEVGTPPQIAERPSVRHPGEPLRIVWSGLHMPGKALPILLRAVASLPSSLQWELHILGDGPCKKRWHRLADRLGLAERCVWHGWVGRPKALDVMAKAHVCAITSMLDLTSTILIEALAQGLPVVCPDHFGFSDVVNHECGVRLPVRSRSQLQAELAVALEKLASNEAQRYRLAAGALRRAGDFSWEKKAQAVDRIYRRVTGVACSEAFLKRPDTVTSASES